MNYHYKNYAVITLLVIKKCKKMYLTWTITVLEITMNVISSPPERTIRDLDGLLIHHFRGRSGLHGLDHVVIVHMVKAAGGRGVDMMVVRLVERLTIASY